MDPHSSFVVFCIVSIKFWIQESRFNISISFPVLSGIIVSLSHHSLAPITGVPQAILSTGDIPKSSSIGIYIVERAP